MQSPIFRELKNRNQSFSIVSSRISLLVLKSFPILLKTVGGYNIVDDVFSGAICQKFIENWNNISSWEIINDGKFEVCSVQDDFKKVEIQLWLSDKCTSDLAKGVSVRISVWGKDEFNSYSRFVAFKKISFLQTTYK